MTTEEPILRLQNVESAYGPVKAIRGVSLAVAKGSIVTVPRTQAHLIVTEFGVADLAGKSTWQRAEALINVAHPDLRDGLIKDAEKMNIWRKASK